MVIEPSHAPIQPFIRDVWAIVSDLHCNSTLGLCPVSGVQLDEGGWYLPSNEQKKLWECWVEYWAIVRARLHPGDLLHVVVNGDAIDGDHHRTRQIISKNLAATQHEIAVEALQPALALKPHAVFVVRGTEAHVGGSAEYEERLARAIGGVRRTDDGAYSWWHLQAISQGVLLDFAHHGTVGRLPWTRPNATVSLAARIALAAVKAGRRAPDLAIRSDKHQGADSYDHLPVRVIQTRAWQLSTAYVHKIAAGSLPEIGGLIVTCANGKYDVEKVEFEWKREEPWQSV